MASCLLRSNYESSEPRVWLYFHTLIYLESPPIFFTGLIKPHLQLELHISFCSFYFYLSSTNVFRGLCLSFLPYLLFSLFFHNLFPLLLPFSIYPIFLPYIQLYYILIFFPSLIFFLACLILSILLSFLHSTALSFFHSFLLSFVLHFTFFHLQSYSITFNISFLSSLIPFYFPSIHLFFIPSIHYSFFFSVLSIVDDW